MKILKYLPCVLLILAAIACSDDETTEQNSIIGVWDFVSQEIQGVASPASGCELNQRITFSNDFTGNDYFPENELNDPCDFETLQFTWSRNADQLNLDVISEGNFKIQILRITASELQIVVIENNNMLIPDNQRRILNYIK